MHPPIALGPPSSAWRTPAVILAMRLPDRAHRLRGALGLGLLPDADVVRQRLGPRGVLARDGDPDAALGRRSAVSPARSRIATARRGCSASARCSTPSGLPPWPIPTTPGMLHLTAGGGDRLRARRLLVHHRDRRLRQADAAEQWRTLAFGAGTAAGSFGQFLFSPLAVALIDQFGWQHTLVIFVGRRAAHHPAVAVAGDATPRRRPRPALPGRNR